MQRFPDRTAGFTLLELMLVVLIISITTALAIPMMLKYDRKEDARGLSQRFASILTQARSRAISQGTPTFVLFNSPAVPELEAGAFALVVIDRDANAQISVGDDIINIHPDIGMNPAVTGYGFGPVQPFPAAPPPPEDNAMGPGSALGDINAGASFANDPTTGVPAVGFSPQGVPVALVNPMDWTDWGTGAGAYYFTDNDTSVFAVIQLPLGGTRVRVLSPALGTWR